MQRHLVVAAGGTYGSADRDRSSKLGSFLPYDAPLRSYGLFLFSCNETDAARTFVIPPFELASDAFNKS